MAAPGRPPRELIYALGVEPRIIPDPGDGGAIPNNQSGYVNLVTAGAETRTLADPVFVGQVLTLIFIEDNGNCVVTASSAVNQTGNNTLTFTDVGEVITLLGAYNATDGWEWKDLDTVQGCALTTV